MALQPSRREVVVGGASALAGGVAGALGRPLLSNRAGRTEEPAAPVPLSWADVEWPFPDYDAARSRRAPAESAPDDGDDLSIAWRFRNESVFRDRWAPPVVANGRVFTAAGGDRGTSLWGFDLETGDVAWTVEVSGAPGMDPELAAPGDGLYFRIDDEDTPLGCLGASTGEVVWRVTDPPYGGWTMGAGRLYYGDRSNGSLRAYDARRGRRLWSTSVDEQRLLAQSFHPRYGLAATSLGTLYLLSPEDGSVRWQAPVNHHVRSGPVIAEGHVFVSKWTDGMDLLAFDAETGERRWRYPLSPTEVETDEGMFRRWYDLGAVADGTVLFREQHADPTPNALHAVDVESGEHLWRRAPPEGTGFSNVAVVGDAVYVTAVGEAESELLRLGLADGETRSSVPLPGGAGTPLVAGGRVVLRTETGLLGLA